MNRDMHQLALIMPSNAGYDEPQPMRSGAAALPCVPRAG